jgi:hypothetical protein
MSNTQTIGICDFIDPRGLKSIRTYNIDAHGLTLPAINIDIDKLKGLTYYYRNNNSYIIRATSPFGHRYNERHNKPTFVRKNLYFYKEDLQKIGDFKFTETPKNQYLRQVTHQTTGKRNNKPILSNEKFDIVNKAGCSIRCFNSEKYGLVKVIGKQAANYIGLRYFYVQNQGTMLRRANMAFVQRLGCENTTYYFYKEDLDTIEFHLKKDSNNQFDFKPVTPVTTVLPITNDTTVTTTSDKLLQLIIELQETEKKVVQIKQQIKDALSL